MPSPFKPSALAFATGAVFSGETTYQQPGPLVEVGGKKPVLRNPLFQSTAEAEESVPYFMKVRKTLPKEYAILPGGAAVYTDAHPDLVPWGPDVVTAGLDPTFMPITDGLKVVRPPVSNGAMQAFPQPHADTPVNVAYKR